MIDTFYNRNRIKCIFYLWIYFEIHIEQYSHGQKYIWNMIL